VALSFHEQHVSNHGAPPGTRVEPQAVDEPASDAPFVASLNELGLTPNQSRAYVALLRRGPATATEIALRARVPRPKIYDVLQSLERHGLCMSSGDRALRWAAVSPDAALPDLVQRREQERRMQAERDVGLARELAGSLPSTAEAALPGGLPTIEALIGRERIALAFEALVATAEHGLEIVQAQPMVQPTARWNDLEVEALGRGVTVRVLYTPETAADPVRYVPLLRAGGEGRLSERLVLKLAIRDGEEALVALRDPSFTADDDGFTSIRIVGTDLVVPLRTLFRREWRHAKMLPRSEIVR
jgi:HTH-type transcriptional regulator, sugar sensing transcriptional regulator